MSPIEIVWLFASLVYGVAIGSFLNVVIYRLPRGQSVSKPVWSYCPNCEHRLSSADLIPVLSFLMLGRKCRYCRQPISWRYCSVELLTGILFVLVCLHDGPEFDTVFDALFVALLIPAFFIDLEHFIIPDELNALGFAVGVCHNLYRIYTGSAGMWIHPAWMQFAVPGSIGSAIICALIFHLISFAGLLYYAGQAKKGSALIRSAGSFWVGVLDDYVYLIVKFLGFGLWLPTAKRFILVRETQDSGSLSSETGTTDKTRADIAQEIESDEEQTGMGQGDAKFALMIGANLLLPLSLVSFFIALLSGAVIGVIMTRGRGKAAIPFGPFLAVGALLSLLWCGEGILTWYVHYAHIAP